MTTFVLARNHLLDQREASLTRQAFADANVLRGSLATAGVEIGDALSQLVPEGGSDVVVRSGDSWYSTSLDVGARDVPPDLREAVAAGNAARVRTESAEGPHLVVGVAVRGADLEFYEVTELVELESELRTLATVLAVSALAATVAGAAFGAWASGRAVQPLDQVTAAATDIAGGDLARRLPPTEDADLVAIVGSFNSMVDALAARIDRDARFVGDVSHELRSPLTTLVTSVELLAARRDELSPRSRQALTLVEGELARFRRTLDDLLELARMDSAQGAEPPPPVSLSALVREVITGSGRSASLLQADDDGRTIVRADKGRLERAVRNLLDNADRHAGGACAVRVERQDGSAVLSVEDAGPGVPLADRERVFDRFARGPRAARGSLPGAGLGLAIVAETATRAGGTTWCSASPWGGARFCLSLPAVAP
ncbi:HAMP domain-containing sensor histidine kinase [Geodermatophilus sp. DSM 44513]|uniref:sensor histidine kinase n=1 Tax=Geodermatophilus sp. DSM 44513 TaxID=1528104 RepID=UPI0028F6E41D|nr:HAMP domain-containing sensor histidine kinase [Geodermatophilus sp. DSM 44513]WNV76840.1 HAMP domain-containing sensor histidine kinase [Geodermatophilus sp. DSM 44513]